MICSRAHSIEGANTHGTAVFTEQSMRSNSMKRQVFNTPPPPPAQWRVTRTRRSLWALFVVCAQAQAPTNTTATGEPAVTAADGADLTMAGPNANSTTLAQRGATMIRRSLWALMLLALITVRAQAQAQDTAPDFGDASVTGSDLIWLTDRDLNLVLPAATGGNGTITYSLSPTLTSATRLRFDAATRTISGRPAFSVGTNNFTLTATDADGDTDTLTFRTKAAADAVPAFAADANIADQMLVRDNAVTLTLPGGSGGNTLRTSDFLAFLVPLTYTLTPALPAGLTFDADARTISGTPTAAAAEAQYTYRVADGDSNTLSSDESTLTFTITVTCASGETHTATDLAPDFGSASVEDQAWEVGTAITDLTLPAACGGNGTLSYALSPALPAGLTFDAASRTISGTPTAAAPAATYTYTAGDGDSNTASGDADTLTFSVTVASVDIRLRLRLFLEGPLR